MAKITTANKEQALKGFIPSTIKVRVRELPKEYKEPISSIADKLRAKKDEDNEIRLSPPFQRDFVWKGDKMDRLINTILERGSIPIIYLGRIRPKNGESIHPLVCVDGKQRLTTIRRLIMNTHVIKGIFINDDSGLRPDPTMSVNRYIGKRFRDFDQVDKDRVLDYMISFVEERAESPEDLTQQFLKLNNGSAAMSQEDVIFTKYEETPIAKAILGFLHQPSGKSLVDREKLGEKKIRKLFAACASYFAVADNFFEGVGIGGLDRFLFSRSGDQASSVSIAERLMRMDRAVKTFDVMFDDIAFMGRRFTKNDGVETFPVVLRKQIKTKMAIIAFLYGQTDHSKFRSNIQGIKESLVSKLSSSKETDSRLFDCLTVQTVNYSRRLYVMNEIRKSFGLPELAV